MTESIRTVPQNSFQNTPNCKHFSANVRKWGPFRTTEKAHSERRSMWIGFNIAQNATNIQALQGKCTKARSYSHKPVKLRSHRRSMWIGFNNIVQKASHMQALYDKCKKVSTLCTTEKLRSDVDLCEQGLILSKRNQFASTLQQMHKRKVRKDLFWE